MGIFTKRLQKVENIVAVAYSNNYPYNAIEKINTCTPSDQARKNE